MHIFKIRASVPQSNLIVIYKYTAVFKVFSYWMLMPTTEWKPKATARHENVLWLTSLPGDKGWFAAISSGRCQYHTDAIISY